MVTGCALAVPVRCPVCQSTNINPQMVTVDFSRAGSAEQKEGSTQLAQMPSPPPSPTSSLSDISDSDGSDEEEEGLVGCSLAMFDAGIYCTSSVNYGRQLQGLRAVSNVD